MNEYYYELAIKDNIRDPLLNYAKVNNNWRFHRDFFTTRAPSNILQNTVLNDLILKFSAEPTIFKMEPNTLYTWHTDATRSCAINMLLDGNDSLSLFGELTGGHHLWKFFEVPHGNNRFFLVNTLKNHAVLNRSCTRYMLSVGFYLPNTFESMREKCQELNL